jgi:uncharacterized protein YjiK
MMMIRRVLMALITLAACAPPHEAAEAQSVARTARGSLFAEAPARQWRLPRQLREISGLATTPDGRLFGHDDEIGLLHEIDPARGALVKTFALGQEQQTGDFEGLAIGPDETFWLVTSAGRLLRFQEGGDGARVPFEAFDAGLGEICEIEGLAYLPAEESLILACKQNHARDMRHTVSLYLWSAAGGLRQWIALPEAEIAAAAGVRRFRPSSVEYDAASGRVLVLSANDNALAELSGDGALLRARALGGEHAQAEGMAVLADGSLAIADEAAGGQALLSIYARGGE